MNEATGQRTPRLKRHWHGYEIRRPLPLGSADISEYQVIDEAVGGGNYCGDDVAILLSIRDLPAEVLNGQVNLIRPAHLHLGTYYTLREPNDYRFDWAAKRWLPVPAADRPPLPLP